MFYCCCCCCWPRQCDLFLKGEQHNTSAWNETATVTDLELVLWFDVERRQQQQRQAIPKTFQRQKCLKKIRSKLRTTFLYAIIRILWLQQNLSRSSVPRWSSWLKIAKRLDCFCSQKNMPLNFNFCYATGSGCDSWQRGCFQYQSSPGLNPVIVNFNSTFIYS